MSSSIEPDEVEHRALLPKAADNSVEMQILDGDRRDHRRHSTWPRFRGPDSIPNDEAADAIDPSHPHDPTNEPSKPPSPLNQDSLRYTTTSLLSHSISSADRDRDHQKLQPWSLLMSRSKTMLATQLLLALLTCACNIAFLIWAYSVNKPLSGIGTLYQGSCDTADRLNTGAHVVLNVFSSLFLGAGNYCMQVLVAPSRRQVRRAGKFGGRSYDVGVHSLRNLRRIPGGKKVLWGGLCACSGLLHFT